LLEQELEPKFKKLEPEPGAGAALRGAAPAPYLIVKARGKIRQQHSI